MLYEQVPEPYAPPQQLVVISNSEKGIGNSVERRFPDALLCAPSHRQLQARLLKSWF